MGHINTIRKRSRPSSVYSNDPTLKKTIRVGTVDVGDVPPDIMNGGKTQLGEKQDAAKTSQWPIHSLSLKGGSKRPVCSSAKIILIKSVEQEVSPCSVPMQSRVAVLKIAAY